MSIPLSDFETVSSSTNYFALFACNTATSSPTVYLADICLSGYTTWPVTITVTSGGTPVPGAIVSADTGMAVTNTSGVAVLNLSNGTYPISATKTGYYAGSGTVTVSRAATSAAVTIASTSGAPWVLTVNVKEGAGQFAEPLVNANVMVNGVSTKTGADGNALMNVGDGTYPVTVTKAGYTGASGTATISGGNATISLAMQLTRRPSASADTWSPGAGWNLVWSDEFATSALDTTKWSFQVEPAGTFNSELQSYTNSGETCFVTNRDAGGTDGTMVIQAVNTAPSTGSGDFTSARMITWGHKDFLYGKIAARIQVPYGQGIWPAFWMLGSDIDENPGGTVPWPKCGEIDIMEKKGGDDAQEKQLLGTYHFWNDTANAWQYFTGYRSLPACLSDDFHVYEVEWNANSIVWRVDGVQYHSVDTTSSDYDEFRKNFYILLNLAVGGTFDGNPDATTVFPQYMFVDWVRVYQ
jgi:beta-glucanase (GH16 family)